MRFGYNKPGNHTFKISTRSRKMELRTGIDKKRMKKKENENEKIHEQEDYTKLCKTKTFEDDNNLGAD